jgi:hypothetical protein
MITITENEMNDIDLDIYSSMKKMPNNELYNSIYLRWDKNTNKSFFRVICNNEDISQLLSQLVFDLDKDGLPTEESWGFREAFLNLAINILLDSPKEVYDMFIESLTNNVVKNLNP